MIRFSGPGSLAHWQAEEAERRFQEGNRRRRWRVDYLLTSHERGHLYVEARDHSEAMRYAHGQVHGTIAKAIVTLAMEGE